MYNSESLIKIISKYKKFFGILLMNHPKLFAYYFYLFWYLLDSQATDNMNGINHCAQKFHDVIQKKTSGQDKYN